MNMKSGIDLPIFLIFVFMVNFKSAESDFEEDYNVKWVSYCYLLRTYIIVRKERA